MKIYLFIGFSKMFSKISSESAAPTWPALSSWVSQDEKSVVS